MLDDNVPGQMAVWMGLTRQTPADYARFFVDMEELASSSPIQLALGTNFIDTDWFIAITTPDLAAQPVEQFAQELDCSRATTAQVVAAAHAKGLTHANALFFYVDAAFTADDPACKYNDLLFIGNFCST